MKTAKQSKRWVMVRATDRQEFVCSKECMLKSGRRVLWQSTLRVAAESACCTVCREYGKYQESK